ncbi:MAG: hypothetical protein LC799_08545 [Actinobacteria bacterium]|nr:hypothetical protein [Actinomycetota bacterium]
MWALLSRRLRMWVFFALATPALAWLLGKVGDSLEARSGPSSASRTLQNSRNWLQRHSRAPLARRGTIHRR